MFYKKMGDTYALRLEKGEEIINSIRTLCQKEHISAGFISGLGACNHAVVGLFKTAEKRYVSAVLEEDMEITSLTGNISSMNDEVYLHLHASFANEQNLVRGGHLNEATVSATAEIFLTQLPGTIGRYFDEEIGLNLMILD